MNKEQYLRRQEAWNFFHAWEKERQYREYAAMSYEKRSEIGRMLFDLAQHGEFGSLKNYQNNQLDIQHKCHMVQLRARLKKNL